MAHESFEDEEVAEYLNKHFVAIKVDKEERPDVDSIYMSVCQKLTGSGGWPLTIFMLPNQKPFYAGTYFPKKSKYQMPGLLDILGAVKEKWETDKDELINSSEAILSSLSQEMNETNKTSTITQELVDKAASSLLGHFDKTNGGFGRAPKFPTPHNLMFLLRVYYHENNKEALTAVEKTLDAMYKGGIFDHLGYGFSRYSTDSKWLVPHFEKMLYDNAMLIMTYLEAYQITKKNHYKNIAKMTMEYVMRELTDEAGGFYCAQDADSEGVEGKYYVFTPDEIIKILGEEDGNYFNEYYGITKKGNFEGFSIPNRLHINELENQSYHTDSMNDLLQPEFTNSDTIQNMEHITSGTLESDRISDLRQKVFKYRLERTKLHKDDKILTSWNGIMIVAFAKAYQVLQDETYLVKAKHAEQFVQEYLCDGDKLAVHYRDGKAIGEGHIDDYSFYIWSLITLYEATLELDYLERAIRLTTVLIDNFYDKEQGGFYLYSKDAESLIVRPKEIYDGAIPSGNSVAAYVLSRLSSLTADTTMSQIAEGQLQFIVSHIEEYPSAYSFSMMALMQAIYPTKEVVCVVQNSEQRKEVETLIAKHFLPNVTVLLKNSNNQDQLASVAAFTTEYELDVVAEPSYYVCENHACRAPVHTIKELEEMLIKP